MNALPFVLGLSIAVTPLPAAAPSHGLAPCLHTPFRGVTQTLETGEIVGDPDSWDWGCVGAVRGTGATTSGHRTLREADVPPAPPPTGTCIRPAAPNPMTHTTRLTLGLGQTARVRLAIYGQTWRHGPREVFLVRTLFDRTLAAGQHQFLWDRTDDQGDQVPASIYRVVVETGGQALCGDLEVQ